MQLPEVASRSYKNEQSRVDAEEDQHTGWQILGQWWQWWKEPTDTPCSTSRWWCATVHFHDPFQYLITTSSPADDRCKQITIIIIYRQ